MTLNGEDSEPRFFLEWPYNVPLLHFLLVSSGTKVVPSRVYKGDSALLGDGPASRALVLRFLSWMETRAPHAAASCSATRMVLSHPLHQATAYLLEPADAYAMNEDTPGGRSKLVSSDASAAPLLATAIAALINKPGSTLSDAATYSQDWRLTDAFSQLNTDMGLVTSAEAVIATWS